jgi:hypothetical protein
MEGSFKWYFHYEQILLRSLETYSIFAPENYYIIGKDRETFLAQVRMLYPKDEVVDAAEIIFDFLKQKENQSLAGSYIGPNFAFLQRLNRRYAIQTGLANYLLDNEKDQELQRILKAQKNEHEKDIERTVIGFIRALEQDYPEIETIKIKGQVCGYRSKVEQDIYLGVHPKKVIDVIWASRLEKMSDLAESNLLEIGVHPIFILSSTADVETDIDRFKRDYPLAGRCIIFFQLSNLQKNWLEVLSVDHETMDIRPVAHQLATSFKEKIRKLRDEIAKISKHWFEQVDEQGYVLRPLIFTKSEEDNLLLLAEGYMKMLIHQITSTELGIKQEVKFMDSEEYNRFLHVLNATEVRAKLQKDGYKGSGLFARVLSNILAGILVLSSSWTPSLGESFRKNILELNGDQKLDLGCVIDSGSFKICENNELIISTEEEGLIFFFLNLLIELQKLGTISAMDITKYASALDSI